MKPTNITLLDKEKDVYIEIGARLNIKFEGSDLQVETIFVGDKTGEYIVLTSPSEVEPVRETLVKGDKVVAKYFCQGQALEFQTQLIEFTSEPIQLILLKYPDFVRECDLRSQKRINCFISAVIEVETEKNNDVVTGVIKNISKNGCRFLIKTSKNIKEMFQINEQITLKCHFPGIVGQQEALGRVQDIQKEDDGIAIGMEFSDLLWWIPPYA